MHEHDFCQHKIKYCSKCDTVFCSACDSEWNRKYRWVATVTGTNIPSPLYEPAYFNATNNIYALGEAGISRLEPSKGEHEKH